MRVLCQKKCEARRYAGFCGSQASCKAYNLTAITLGRGSPTRLGATYPPAPRSHINAGLFGIAARRDCPFHPGQVAPARLVSVALILTSRWRAVNSYAALCSPDVPPVPGFPYGTSGGLACFTY